jgi:hypothetical protein
MKELPKALSARERRLLVIDSCDGPGRRALAWIDAATELLAEYAAQAVVDGQRIAELEATREAYDLLAQDYAGADADRRAYEAHIAELERELGSAQRFGNAQEARCRDLDAAADVARDQALDKLAAANALLEYAANVMADSAHQGWLARHRSYLANQPAAPQNAEPRYVKPVASTPRERDLEDKCERICEEYCKLSATWQDAVRLFNAWLVDSEGFCPVAQETRELLRGRPVLAQPAAPARTEGEQALRECRDLLRQLSPRVVTEAEQAVLDACAACTEADLRWVESGVRLGGRDTLIGIARAELALRGLK